MRRFAEGVIVPETRANPQPEKSSAISALPVASRTEDWFACVAAVVPLCPLVHPVKSLELIPPTRISSSSIKTISLATIPAVLATVMVVSLEESVPPSFTVVVRAPVVVPPQTPAPQPVPKTELFKAVPI